MKKCPECGREYDLSMSFCLDDGAELLYGPASMDKPQTDGFSSTRENATAILPDGALRGEDLTQYQAQPPSGLHQDEGFWIAVLPFRYSGSDADIRELAEGLLDEIVTGFSRFSYLRVIAR